MYAGVIKETTFVIDLTDEEFEYGPTPEGYEVVSVPIPEGVTVELGMIYDFDTETFSEYVRPYIPDPPEPIEPPEPTQEEIFDKILINTEYLAAMAEMEAEA